MKTNLNIFPTEKLFLIAYGLMLFSWMFENIMYVNTLLPFIRGISYILAIVCIAFNFKRFSFNRILISFILTICVIISVFVSKSNIVLPLCCFALASRFVDFNKLVKFDYKIKIFYFILILIFFLLDFSEKSVFYSYSGVARCSLGFGNPNTLGYYIFSICSDYVYIKANKLTFFNVVVGCLVGLFLSIISLSRTSSFLIMLLFIFSFFAHKFKFILKYKLLKKIILCSFLLFSLFTVIFIQNYSSSNKLYLSLNNSLSGRIVNSYRYLNKYDFKLWGQEISLNNYDNTINLYLDNGYLKLLLNNGIVIFIIMFLIYYFIIKDSYKSSNIILLIIIFIYLIYGLFENAFFWLTGNVFLLEIFCKDGAFNLLLKGGYSNEKN